MTMKVIIKDEYLEQFEQMLKTLPTDAIEIKKSLDEEIKKRSDEYRSGKMEIEPFGTGLDEIRERLLSKL